MAILAKLLTFNSKLNWLLMAPPVIGVFGYLYDMYAGTSWPVVALQGVAFVLVIYLYVVQQRYIVKRYEARKRSTMKHMALIGFTFVVPTIAASLGDYIGASRFSNSANGITSDLWIGCAVGVALSIIFLYVIAVGNALRITTDNQKSWVNALCRLAYSLAFLVVAGISWFAYSLVYSLHDPSTE